MFCYLVAVATTNSMNDTFKIGDEYHECEDGAVYVFAENVAEAAKKIPKAISVRKVGCAFPSGEGI